jgi:hypothetical protein
MSTLLLALALGSAFYATTLSRSTGLGVVLVVGYFYGIIRGNLTGGYTHFLFDAAVVGYYSALLFGKWTKKPENVYQKKVRDWFVVLVGWTLVMFLIPMQDFRVQLVGLRGNCFFLPFLLVGSRLEDHEAERLSIWLASLNLIAIGFAVAQFVIGVPAFFPDNEINKIIHASHDASGSYRIPATFANAHSFGGMMAMTLPWLLAAWTQKRQDFLIRTLLMAAILAAIIGVFMSAARTAVIELAIIVLVATLSGRMPPIFQTVWVFLLAGAASIVRNEDRFQRFMTLFDSDQVVDRIKGSVNISLFDLFCTYPMGNGLGAGGTSLPYFLTYLVINPIGLESEYSRILLELGIPGLLLWAGFIVWFLWHFPTGKHDPWIFCRQLLWFAALFQFGNGLVGIGMMTAIPQSAMLLLGIGFAATPRIPDRRATGAKETTQHLRRPTAAEREPSATLQ